MNNRPFRTRHRWHKWRRLPGPERRIFLESIVLLPLAGLLLRFWRYQSLYAALQKVTPLGQKPAHEDALHVARRSAIIVASAARYTPYDVSCLRRSLILWWQLRRLGIEAQLRIGVSKEAQNLSGHAWVEYHGYVINDRQDIAETFVPML